MLWSLLEETLSLDMSPKIYATPFRNFYLYLTHQYVLEYWAKESTAVYDIEIPVCFVLLNE